MTFATLASAEARAGRGCGTQRVPHAVEGMDRQGGRRRNQAGSLVDQGDRRVQQVANDADGSWSSEPNNVLRQNMIRRSADGGSKPRGNKPRVTPSVVKKIVISKTKIAACILTVSRTPQTERTTHTKSCNLRIGPSLHVRVIPSDFVSPCAVGGVRWGLGFRLVRRRRTRSTVDDGGVHHRA